MRCADGHENPDDLQFCSTCGLALPATPATYLPPPLPPDIATAPFGAAPPPPPGYRVSQRPRNGFGITALVLGIVSFFACGLSLVIGPLAIVFGVLGIRRANRSEATNKTMAIFGLVLGALATALYGVYVVVVIAANS